LNVAKEIIELNSKNEKLLDYYENLKKRSEEFQYDFQKEI